MRTIKRICAIGVFALVLLIASHALADLAVGSTTTLSVSGVGFITTNYNWYIIEGGTSLNFTATGTDEYKTTVGVATVIGTASGTAVVQCNIIGYRQYYDPILKEIVTIPMIDTRKYSIKVVDVVTALSVSPTSCTMLNDGTKQLTASVTPSTATVTWASSDTTVATVSSSGLITAKKKGSVTITATAGTKTANCAVTVNWRYPVTSMQFSPANYTVYMEDSPVLKVVPVITPATSAAGTLTWTTSNSAVATVSGGTITPLKSGTATITASLSGVSASVTVNVAYRYPVDSITLSQSTATMYMEDGGTLSLTKTILPASSAAAPGYWSSSNSSVAAVNANGVVTAKAPGSTYIYYNAGGKSGSCYLEVKWRYPVTYFYFYNDMVIMRLSAGSITIPYYMEPASSANAPLTWASSDTSVLKAEKGILTPIKPGIVTVTATCMDGRYITCTVAVFSDTDPEYRFKYTTTDAGLTITGWVGTLSSTMVIPATYDGKPVIAIAAGAFYNAINLVNVTVPKSVQSIGEGAFKYCVSLTNITLPFVGRSRLEIYKEGPLGYIFGYGTSTNGSTLQYAYYSWYEETFDEKEGFYYNIPASLRSVTITDATMIPVGAFNNCTKLTSIKLNKGVTRLSGLSFSGANGVTTMTLPDTLTEIGSFNFKGNTGLTSLNFPAALKIINDNAFSGCTNFMKQGSVILPYGLTTIGVAAFRYCAGIKSITVPASVTYIGRDAFTGCTALTLRVVKDSYAHTYAIAKNLPYILSNPITTITLSQNSLTIYAGDKPGLTAQTVPAGRQADTVWRSSNPDVVTVDANGILTPVSSGTAVITCAATDGGSANATCQVQVMLGIQQINLANNSLQMAVGESVIFLYTLLPERYKDNPVKLASSNEGVVRFDTTGRLFAISTGMTTVSVTAADGETAQSSCTVTVTAPKVLALPASAASIPAGAFQNGTSIQSVDLRGTAVKSIAAAAFKGCTGLKSVYLPATVTSIDDTAFSGCTKVTFTCPEGSYASTYAQNNGIPWIAAP